jgi:quercetin dioxygenase-like cupin family protein
MKMNLKDIPEIEYVSGFFGRMIHTDSTTLAYWSIKKGAQLPEHHHIHEQVINVFEGELQMVIGGEKMILGPGDTYSIPSNVPHSGVALTDCRVLDVFTPAREDYKT